MSNARGYPPYPPRGKKPHGPSRCRFYTGPPSSRRSRDQDGRDLLYDLHTITGQSEGTHTHATQTKRREHQTGPAVREAEPEVRNTGDGAAGESNGEREASRRTTGGERGLARAGAGAGGDAGTRDGGSCRRRRRRSKKDGFEHGEDREEPFWI